MPCSRQEFHHFSEYPLIISSAVTIDVSILCTYFLNGLDVEQGLNDIRDFCQNKFDILVGTIAISKTAIEIPDEEFNEIIFEYLTESYINKCGKDLSNIDIKVPIVSMSDIEKARAACRYCVGILEGNVSAI